MICGLIKRKFSTLDDATKRQKKIKEIYSKHFQGLDRDEKLKLAQSGKIWWDYSEIQYRPKTPINQEVNKILVNLDKQKEKLKQYKDFPKWNSFVLEMTYHSTAIEGNTLSIMETKTILDEFKNEITNIIGFPKEGVIEKRLYNLVFDHVKDTVNHATAMEFLRQKMFGKPLTIENILSLHKYIIPNFDQKKFIATGINPKTHIFRTIPVRVRGSSDVQPYPHEVPAVMNMLLDLHSKQLLQHHPIVTGALFLMNFSFVHPFHDGNGRIARLLLVNILYNAGYFGCIIPITQRSQYMKLFHSYIQEHQVDPVCTFVAERTNHLLNELLEYEATSIE